MKLWLMSLWTSMKELILRNLFQANLNSDSSFVVMKHLKYPRQSHIAYDVQFAEVIWIFLNTIPCSRYSPMFINFLMHQKKDFQQSYLSNASLFCHITEFSDPNNYFLILFYYYYHCFYCYCRHHHCFYCKANVGM